MTKVRSFAKCPMIFLVLLAAASPTLAWAVACDAVFAGGVQSHDPNGAVHMEYMTRIFGAGTVLQTPELTMTHHYQEQRGMCREDLSDEAVCTASGVPAEKSTVPVQTHSYMPATFLTSPGGADNIAVPYRGLQTLDGDSYGAITVGQEATLTLSSPAPNVTMSDVQTNYKSMVEITAGNYWVDGDLDLSGQMTLKRIGGQPGPVNIYVSGRSTLAYGIVLENFSDDRPINIYSFGDINVSPGANEGNPWYMRGALYSNTKIYVGQSVRVTQGVYAPIVDTDNNVHVDYPTLHNEHFLGHFTLGHQAFLNLQPGDYYIDGDLDINVAAVFRNLRGSERPVRLFINGSISLQHAVTFENFSDGQLLLYATGDIDISSQNDVRAFIYAAGDVTISFSGNSRYIGGISGRHVTIGQGSIVQHVAPVDLGPFCDDEPTVAYYQFSHAPAALTCMAEPVIITAYDADHQPVAPAAGTQLVFDSNPATGVWVGGNGWLFSGVESSLVKYLQSTSPGTLSIGVSDGIAVGSSNVEFLDTALKFYGEYPLTDPTPIPPSVAGISAPSYLWAVQTNTDTGACEARTEGIRQVGLGFECLDPGQCVAGQNLISAGTPVSANDHGAGPVYTPVDLLFDANGVASVPFSYTDVGRIRLHGQLPLPAEDEQPAIVLSGASNPFVVRPYTLKVTSVTDAQDNPNPGGGAAGGGFVAAGEPFTAVVAAYNMDGEVTPNFGREASAQGVRLQPVPGLVYPVGGRAGELAAPNNFRRNDTPGDAPGHFVNSSLSWNDVGSITVTPRLVNDSYLGAGDLVELTPSDPIGRFYPNDFSLSDASLTPACGTFSYLGQDAIGVNYTLTARALGGGVVSNYDDSLSYLGTAAVNYVAENGADGIDLGQRVKVAPAPWVAGRRQVSDARAVFARQGSGAPDGPFRALRWGVTLQNERDGRDFSLFNMNASAPGDCHVAGNCTAVALGELDVRYGRLRSESAYGPEVRDLPAPLYTQYWDGQHFRRAVEDSCTSLARSALYYPGGTLDNDANRTVAVGAGQSTGSYTSLEPNGVQILAGGAGQVFSAPGQGNTGRFDIRIDLSAHPWLRFDWNQSGNYDQALPPPASIGFGSYRGHDRVIYWREVFE